MKNLIWHRTTSKKHTIFAGKNALFQALFYDRNGRLAHPDELYRRQFPLQDSICWGVEGAKSANPIAGECVIGEGVHAKIYTLPTGSIIYSSQNNGQSALFEFAILYQGRGPKMRGLAYFTEEIIGKAKDYSSWWKRNGKWKTGLKP